MNEKKEGVEVSVEQLEQELTCFFQRNSGMMNEWLNTPLPRLRGQCPINFLNSATGRERILSLLEDMKYGELS